MKKIIISGIFVLATVLAFTTNIFTNNSKAEVSATISLSGTVMDLNSGETLAGVEVTLEGLDKKAYTDFDGNYTIENLTPGQYNVIASYISYNKSYVEKLELTANEDLNIKLQSSN